MKRTRVLKGYIPMQKHKHLTTDVLDGSRNSNVMTKYMSFIIVLFALFAAATSYANDKIVLKNGDIISGNIESKNKTELIIITRYAGKIKIDWGQVQQVTLGNEKFISLKDGTHTKGSIGKDETGQYILNSKTGKRRYITGSEIVLLSKRSTVPKKERYKVGGHIKLAADLSKGNTNTQHQNVDFELILSKHKRRITFSGADNKAKSGDVYTLSNTRASVKFDRFISERQFWYTQMGAYRDTFKDIRLQTTAGLGLGYQFKPVNNKKISIEGGISYVDEQHIFERDRDYSAFRWAFSFEKKLKINGIKFFHKHNGLWDLKITDNVNVNSQTGFKVPIVKRLNAFVQVNADWDSEPGAGKDDTDLIYLFSLGYQW